MTPEAFIEEHQERFLQELQELLRIPSVSTTPEHNEDVKRCAHWVSDHLKSIGFESSVHKTPGHPIVFAERCPHDDQPTILIYGHYDVQPPDPLALWHSPPFEPTIRDGKIFARGATDDKGQVFAHIKGLEASLAAHGELPVNVKLLIEGEEEVGSQNLERFVRDNDAMLACDAVVISDTAMFQPGLPSITYSLRGLIYFEVTARGPSHDLHSGVYGGAVPNPLHTVAAIVASLHDEKGRITIPGFYDDVRDLEEDERAALAALPFDEQAFQDEVGASKLVGEEGFTTLERIWARPTLDCNGIQGGFTGKGAKTVIGDHAFAKISCRLVPDQDPETIAAAARAYIEDLAPEGIELGFEFFHGARPVIAERDNPTVQAALRALEKTWGREAVFTRSGGSIPVVATFAEALGVPSVLMGFGLEDDRLHSPNEKFDLENFYAGIRASAYLWEELAQGE